MADLNFQTPWTYTKENIAETSGEKYSAFVIRDRNGDRISKCSSEDDAQSIVQFVNIAGQNHEATLRIAFAKSTDLGSMLLAKALAVTTSPSEGLA